MALLILTHSKKIDEHDNTQRSYYGVVLKNYPRAFNGAAKQREEWINAIVQCLENMKRSHYTVVAVAYTIMNEYGEFTL